MPSKKFSRAPAKRLLTQRDRKADAVPSAVREALASLERMSSKKFRADMHQRYGIYTEKAFGVPVNAIQKLAKGIGTHHELAAALWETGWYEARMLASFIDDPAQVTPAQMDRWCKDFDNWGICDTVCFKLFDQTPHAFAKVEKWAASNEEFVKRAAYALLACLALHQKDAEDASFARFLPHIERAAADDRNFVKKGVSWALRSVGRRSPGLYAAAEKLAQRLAESASPPARWVGKDVLRDFAKLRVRRQRRR